MFKIILNDEYNTFLPTLGIFAQSWNFLLRYLGMLPWDFWKHSLATLLTTSEARYHRLAQRSPRKLSGWAYCSRIFTVGMVGIFSQVSEYNFLNELHITIHSLCVLTSYFSILRMQVIKYLWLPVIFDGSAFEYVWLTCSCLRFALFSWNRVLIVCVLYFMHNSLILF